MPAADRDAVRHLEVIPAVDGLPRRVRRVHEAGAGWKAEERVGIDLVGVQRDFRSDSGDADRVVRVRFVPGELDDRE